MKHIGKREVSLPKMLKASWKHGSFVYVFAVMFLIYLGVLGPGMSMTKVTNILTHTVSIGIIALGMGLIIISGEIDLSVGSTFAFSGSMGILLINELTRAGMAEGPAMFIGLIAIVIIATFIGFINGFLVGKVKIPAFIVTLGTMLIFRSLCEFILKVLPTEGSAQQLQSYDIDYFYKTDLYKFGNNGLGPISYIGIVLVVTTLIVWYIAKYTKFGRRVYALGSNKKASSLAGINVPWTKILIFSFAGALIGLSSFLFISKEGKINSNTAGLQFELYAIASCVIGGISMSGGRGNIIGILFGGMAFQIIDKIIQAVEVNPLINDTIKGSILLLAVILQISAVNKDEILKKLRKYKIIFNPHLDEVLESELRIKVNKINLDYDKKLSKILALNINEEEAKNRTLSLLDERDAIIAKLKAEYAIKIDNAKIKIAEYKLKNEIKSQVNTIDGELENFKLAIRKEYNDTVYENPKLVRTILEAKKDLTIKYFDHKVDALNRIFEAKSNNALLKENAEHLLNRDKEFDADKAQSIYEATIARIDKNQETISNKFNTSIASINAKRESLITKVDAAIQANVANEAAQIELNNTFKAERAIKEEAKAKALKAKEEAKLAKLEEVKAKQDAEMEKELYRKNYIESLCREREIK